MTDIKHNKNLKFLSILGDSVYKGTRLNAATNRFVFTDSQYLDVISKKFNLSIKSNAAFGLTTQRVIERSLHTDLCQSDPKPQIMLLSLGGNDCNYDWAKVSKEPDNVHLPKVTPEQFEINLKNIIEDNKFSGVQTVVVNLIPISTQNFFQSISKQGDPKSILHWLGSVQILYMWHEHYNDILCNVAKQNNLPLLDIRKHFMTSHCYDKLVADDGIHLTQYGYDFMVQCIEGEMGKIKLEL